MVDKKTEETILPSNTDAASPALPTNPEPTAPGTEQKEAKVAERSYGKGQQPTQSQNKDGIPAPQPGTEDVP